MSSKEEIGNIILQHYYNGYETYFNNENQYKSLDDQDQQKTALIEEYLCVISVFYW